MDHRINRLLGLVTLIVVLVLKSKGFDVARSGAVKNGSQTNNYGVYGIRLVRTNQWVKLMITPHKREKLTSIIREAAKKAEKEECMLEDRFKAGIDKLAKDFKTVEPILLSESPLDASHIESQSRRINWLARKLRESNIGISLQQALHHNEAKRQGISCPYISPKCVRSKYRSIDGSCNNLVKPLVGAGFTPFLREIPPIYETSADGRDDAPRRTAKDGKSLPNARVVSKTVHESKGEANPEADLTFHFTMWGQFLAHDTTDRAPGKGHKQAVIDCLNQTKPTPGFTCFNIDVPMGDFFRGFGRTSLNFPRSIEATDMDCATGMREQLNQASAFVDGGSVYGATKSKADFMRSFAGGELCMSGPNHLPVLSHPTPVVAKQGLAYMQAGDDRVTEFTGLTGIETVWPREHNRIAKELAKINLGWQDERLYREAKRIVVAMLQHITYNEWLPAAVGPEMVTKYNLGLLSTGYFTGYDSSVNPSLSNGFSGAAFRFGHSLMRTEFHQMEEDFSTASTKSMVLRDLFFKSNIYLLNEQSFMRGTLTDASEKSDRLVTNNLVNHLYETRPGNGFDLPAFNIQRGREHGIAPYNAWRELFGLSTASQFTTNAGSGFEDLPQDAVALLASVYGHPDDVDVWSAGVSETPLADATLGPLFANMIGRQFRDLRRGDRFWYETNEQPQAFNLGFGTGYELATMVADFYHGKSVFSKSGFPKR